MCLPIMRQVLLPVRSSKQAFEKFVDFSTWWPKEYTWSKDVLKTVGIEARKGGFCYEESIHGFRLNWGTVIQWDPEKTLIFLWQIGPNSVPEPNPEKASEVQIDFVAEEARTLLKLEHRNFERYGEQEAAYRAAMDSEYGWDYLLARYQSVF